MRGCAMPCPRLAAPCRRCAIPCCAQPCPRRAQLRHATPSPRLAMRSQRLAMLRGALAKLVRRLALAPQCCAEPCRRNAAPSGADAKRCEAMRSRCGGAEHCRALPSPYDSAALPNCASPRPALLSLRCAIYNLKFRYFESPMRSRAPLSHSAKPAIVQPTAQKIGSDFLLP